MSAADAIVRLEELIKLLHQARAARETHRNNPLPGTSTRREFLNWIQEFERLLDVETEKERLIIQAAEVIVTARRMGAARD